MDVLDRLALKGRRFERRRSLISGSLELTLTEVLRLFNDKTILDLETKGPGREPRRLRHERGRPVSLIDGIAEIEDGGAEWYEVLQTAPSGDYARVRIISHPSGGELSMLVGRRTAEHSAREDPLLESLRSRGS